LNGPWTDLARALSYCRLLNRRVLTPVSVADRSVLAATVGVVHQPLDSRLAEPQGRSVRRRVANCHPTIMRENTSMTNAALDEPTHILRGLGVADGYWPPRLIAGPGARLPADGPVQVIVTAARPVAQAYGR